MMMRKMLQPHNQKVFDKIKDELIQDQEEPWARQMVNLFHQACLVLMMGSGNKGFKSMFSEHDALQHIMLNNIILGYRLVPDLVDQVHRSAVKFVDATDLRASVRGGEGLSLLRFVESSNLEESYGNAI